jgi:hypothetical protein
MAVDFAIPLFTKVQFGRPFVGALSRKTLTDFQIKSWKKYPCGSAARI